MPQTEPTTTPAPDAGQPTNPPAAPQGTPDATANAAPAAKQTPGWMAQLKDDLKANEVLAGFANVNELSTALLDANGKLKTSLPLLPENATEQQKAEFYNRLGRPEKPEGYTFDKPPLPEGMAYSETMESYFRPVMHAVGLNQQQAAAMAKAFTDLNVAAHAKAVQDTKDAIAKMTTEWGDKSAANFEKVARAFEQFGGKEFADFADRAEIDGVKLGNHPAMIALGLKIYQAVGSDTFVGVGGAAPAPVSGGRQLTYNDPKKE